MSATKQITMTAWQEGKPIAWADVRVARALFPAAGRRFERAATESASMWATLVKYFDDPSTAATRMRHGVPQSCPVVVAPENPVWCALADDADMLIRLPGETGIAGVLKLNEWLNDSGIKYNTNPANPDASAGDRGTWGLAGHRSWAIQQKNNAWQAGPPELDCTTYLNLALSIYLKGNAHEDPYDAATPYGDVSPNHCARDRYKLRLVSRDTPARKESVFWTAEQIDDATEGGMYALELGGGAGGKVLHMALLYDGRVYEYAPHLDQHDSSLEEFVGRFAGRGLFFYLFGPK